MRSGKPDHIISQAILKYKIIIVTCWQDETWPPILKTCWANFNLLVRKM